jgi:hypothetical protein
MMKKIAILFAAALFGQVLLAGPVSPGRALEIGRTILDGPATRGNPSEAYILWDGEFSGSKASEHPAFYVIGRDGGGFVIISGDDRARPVLGLSETNRFETENMPDNVKWWMESMKAYVRKQAVPGNPVRVQWDRLLQTRAGDAHITGTVTGKVEHLTPEWDQGNNDQWLFKQQVYNKYCPLSNGNLTITGCVATAVAEVLTTLSGLYPDDMPDRGTGTVGGYSVGSGYVAPQSYELTTVYNWSGLRTLKNAEAIRQALDNGQSDVVDNLGHLEGRLQRKRDIGRVGSDYRSQDGRAFVHEQDIPLGKRLRLFRRQVGPDAESRNRLPAGSLLRAFAGEFRPFLCF